MLVGKVQQWKQRRARYYHAPFGGRSASTETTKNHKNYENYPEYGNYENYGRGLVGCEGGISRNRCMSMYVYVNFCWEMY